MNIKRRNMLSGAGTIGVAATLAACSDEYKSVAPSESDRHGNPRIPAELNTHTQHIIHEHELISSHFSGGNLYQVNENNFPILTGQNASIVIAELVPGGIREPHWHPSAWEINIIISGEAEWTVVETGGYSENFSAKAGDIVFIPQGSMHYFRNSSQEHTLKTVIIFNVSAQEEKDDISLAYSISTLPPEVLAAIFKVPTSTFAHVPKITEQKTLIKPQ